MLKVASRSARVINVIINMLLLYKSFRKYQQKHMRKLIDTSNQRKLTHSSRNGCLYFFCDGIKIFILSENYYFFLWKIKVRKRRKHLIKSVYIVFYLYRLLFICFFYNYSYQHPVSPEIQFFPQNVAYNERRLPDEIYPCIISSRSPGGLASRRKKGTDYYRWFWCHGWYGGR